MDLIKALKSHSSKWMKTNGTGLEKFYWQDGYGAFSVNPTEIGRVQEYIQLQHEHHRTRSFKEEYLLFLKKYKVEYDHHSNSPQQGAPQVRAAMTKLIRQ